jgi:hypothetical protein
MHAFAFIAVSIAAVTLTVGSIRIARALIGALDLRALGSSALAMALATSIFLVATGLVGRLFHSFDAGLAAAAGAGALLLAASIRLPQTEKYARPKLERRIFVRFLLALLAMTALYANLSFRYQMHDEHAVFGHKSMIEELRYGEYPVFAPPFPKQEARYHSGFDVVAGAIARAFGASSDLSIDLATLAFVIFMSWAAAALAVDSGAERSAPFAAIAIHLGAGLAAFMLAGAPGRHPRCLIQYHHPSCGVELFPTQLLNVFQHPVAAGVPLFLVFAILAPRLASASSPRSRAAVAGVACVVLGALSFAQFVYFALASLAFLAALPVWLYKRGVRTLRAISGPALVSAAVLAGALLIARAMGGMLAPNDTIDPNLVLRRAVLGFPENTTLAGIGRHHLANLGLGFALIPVFIAAASRDDRPVPVLLLAFSLGGIAVAHIWMYTRSWDIVKFPSAASFALTMLYVVVVDRALVGRRFPWVWLARALRSMVIGTGILAALYLLFPLRPEVRPYDLGDFKVDPLVGRCIEWWRAHGYEKSELIYAQSNIAQQLAVFGGLSVVTQDADLTYLGIKDELFYEQVRNASAIRESMSPMALRELGVVWVMFSDQELQNLGPRARGALESPETFELTATLDGERPEQRRRIWRVRSL